MVSAGQSKQVARSRFGLGVAAEFQRWAAKNMKRILPVLSALWIVSCASHVQDQDVLLKKLDKEQAKQNWVLLKESLRIHNQRKDSFIGKTVMFGGEAGSVAFQNLKAVKLHIPNSEIYCIVDLRQVDPKTDLFRESAAYYVDLIGHVTAVD